jgi:apolipoprotein N-acyltransferase
VSGFPPARWFRLSICLAAGAAHALAFAPGDIWWLQVAALAVLFALLVFPWAPAPRAAALHGFAFGLGWFGVGIWWVYISMHVYGQLPAALAVLATLALAAGLALLPAAACAGAAWSLRRRAGVCGGRAVQAQLAALLVALPGAWTGAEWLRGVLFTGFPWIATGYAHSDGPLSGYAPLVGVYGVSLVAAVAAGACALVVVSIVAWRRDTTVAPAARRALAAGAALVVVLPAAGLGLAAIEWTRAEGAPIRVRLVQGNIPQDLKFTDAGLQRAAETHERLLRVQDGRRIDLAVLPESVYPLPLNYLPEPVTRALVDATRTHARALVFGVFIEDPPGRFYNSAVALSQERPAQRYSKRHLVPFGEYVPVGFRWFVDLMHIPIGDQERGPAYQPPFELVGQRIAANICYEDLFGAEIIAAWKDPARAPTLLLNLSNLAWFNDSRALPQHLQISRLRAIETGRPMLRATNTGATAVIDARGRVVAALPFNTEGTLVADVRGHVGSTPYVRFGNWPALALIAAFLVLAVGLGRRQARQ